MLLVKNICVYRQFLKNCVLMKKVIKFKSNSQCLIKCGMSAICCVNNYARIRKHDFSSQERRALIEHHSHAYRIYCTEGLLNSQVFFNKERSVRKKITVDYWISRILLRVVK